MFAKENVAIFILILVQLLFGVHYITSKILINFFPPLLWAFMRAFCTGLMLILIASFIRPHPKLDKKFIVSMVIFSLLGVSLNQSFFLVGLKYTSTMNSAVLNTLVPILTFLIVVVRGVEKANLKNIFGFIAAFLGILIILGAEKFSITKESFIGDLLILLNALVYSFYLAYSKSYIEKYNPLWFIAYLFLFGSIEMGFFSIKDIIYYTWKPIPIEVFWSAVYTIIGGTVIPYLLVTIVLSFSHASKVGLYIYLQPVVAAILGFFILKELPTMRTFIGSIFIFIGLIFTEKVIREKNIEKLSSCKLAS